MKKLMIAACAAVLSVAAQAATVNWGAGTVYAPADAKGTSSTSVKWGATGHKGTMYVFYFDSLSDYQTAQGTDVSKLYENYILNSTKVATAKGTKTASSFGTTIKLEGQPDGTDQAPITIYGMALFVDTDDAKSYENVDAFVKAGFGTATYKDANGTDFTNIGLQQTNWTAYGAVPEPTSGLLLLLGVAGLALRRRRA